MDERTKAELALLDKKIADLRAARKRLDGCDDRVSLHARVEITKQLLELEAHRRKMVDPVEPPTR